MFLTLLSPYAANDARATAEENAPHHYHVGEFANLSRELHKAIDASAFGTPNAEALRRDTLRMVATRIAAADINVLRRPENAAGLLALVLYGAGTQTLSRVLEDDHWIENNRVLGRGLLALSVRNFEEAKSYFAKVDRQALQAAVRASLALVETKMFADSDPKRAITLLQEARIGVPGTGLEEAALRQQIIVLLRLGDSKQAGERLSAYLRRFPQSTYWDSFKALIVGMAGKHGRITAADFLMPSGAVNVPAAANRYRALLVALSERLLLTGALAQSADLADFVCKIEPEESDLRRRAELYKRVAGIGVQTAQASLAALEALDVRRYTPAEQQLIRAAISVARDVEGGFIQASTSKGDATRPTAREAIGGNEMDPATGSPLADNLAAHAEKSLKEAQKSLSGVGP